MMTENRKQLETTAEDDCIRRQILQTW